MAIHLNHSYHHITPPKELSDRLFILKIVGVTAKLLNENSLAEQARQQYEDLRCQFQTEAARICKEKSWSGWFGGGETYTAENIAPWTQSDEMVSSSQISDIKNPDELRYALAQYVDVLNGKQTLYQAHQNITNHEKYKNLFPYGGLFDNF